MLEIKAVKVSEWFGQAQALAREHWQETEAGFSDVPPDLDLSVYRPSGGLCVGLCCPARALSVFGGAA